MKNNKNFEYNKITPSFSLNNENKINFGSILIKDKSNADVGYRDTGKPVFIREKANMDRVKDAMSLFAPEERIDLLIGRFFNMEEVKKREELREKEELANNEKETIKTNLNIDSNYFIDELCDLLSDNNVARKINSQNNNKTKKKRI